MSDRAKFWLLLIILLASIALLVKLQLGATDPSLFQ
jgi:hypothetical protein